MKQADTSRPRYRGYLFWGAVFLLIIYSNSLQVPFVFDDWGNIVERSELQLTSLTPEAVGKTFYKDVDGRKVLMRPISSFTLALNYYFGRHEVSGYHLVNIFIHLLTACFLFKTLCLLVEPRRGRFSSQETVFIAGLATILWAAHPIQTQAVTYIVQRMATLAAMFYVLGLWSYVRFRQDLSSAVTLKNVKWAAASLVFFLGAVLSKENAIIFPLGLLLLELFFFRGDQPLNPHPGKAIGLLCVLVMAGLVALGADALIAFLSYYDILPFSLQQRLLTEPRVLFFYLSQLFYPVPSRFSVEHYMPISNSLFDPMSTVWALGGIGLLVMAGFIAGRRYPLIGFPVVFYFVHHLMESSLLPLALMYEHRNYLPSLFLFLPVAVLLAHGLRIYRPRNVRLWSALFLFAVAIIFLLGVSTHIRNHDWRSEKSLWTSALRVAPEAVRPYIGLGVCYTRQDARDLNKALAIFRLAADKQETYWIFEKAMLWGKIAKIFEESQQWERAEEALQNSLTVYRERVSSHPALMNRSDTKIGMARIYSGLAHLSSAFKPLESLVYIDQALALHQSSDYDIDKALYQNLTGDYQGGLQTLRQALQSEPHRWEISFALGHMFTFTEAYDRGRWFYRRALALAREGDVPPGRYRSIFMYLAENRRLAGKTGRSEQYVQAYLGQASRGDIAALVRKHSAAFPGRYPFVDTVMTLRQLRDGMCRQAEILMGR